METKNSIKRLLRIVILSASVFLLLAIVIYFLNFKDQSISSLTSNWGSFGDYIGGILNPIFAFFNLILLIYIAYLVNHSEEGRFRSSFIKEIYDKFNKKSAEFDTRNWTQAFGDNFVEYLWKFKYENKYMFGEGEAQFDKLCNDLQSEIIRLNVAHKQLTDVCKFKGDSLELRKYYLTSKLEEEEKFAIEYYLKRVRTYEIQLDKMLKFMRMFVMNQKINSSLDFDVESKALADEKTMNNIIFDQINEGII